MTRPRWKPEDLATVRRMRAEGRRDEEIGVAVGRSTVAIQAMIVKLKQADASIPRQRRNTWTPKNLAEVKRLQAEGLTHDQMARRIGTSSTRIGRMLAAVAQCPTDPAPPEPVHVSKPRVDPRQVVRELEHVRAALTRAERRYAEVMAPAYGAIRGTLKALGLPFLNLAEPERDLAEDLCAALRDQGYVLVEASRA